MTKIEKHIRDLRNILKIAEEVDSNEEKLQYLKTGIKVVGVIRFEIMERIDEIEEKIEEDHPFSDLGVAGWIVTPKKGRGEVDGERTH